MNACYTLKIFATARSYDRKPRFGRQGGALFCDENSIIDYLPGAVLLLAALAKVGNLNFFGKAIFTLVTANDSVETIPAWAIWISIAVFAAEMTCGSLLLARPGDRFCRRLAAVLFIGFVAVQVHRLNVTTPNPCGCFGLLQGAAFLRPFAEPGYALLSNVIIALTLLAGDICCLGKHILPE